MRQQTRGSKPGSLHEGAVQTQRRRLYHAGESVEDPDLADFV